VVNYFRFKKGDYLLIKIEKIIIVFLVISLSACSPGVKKKDDVVLQTLSTDDIALTLENGFLMEDVVESKILAKQSTVVKPANASRTGIPWLISKVSTGSPKTQTTTYRITYDSLGTVLSKVAVPNTTIVKAATPTLYMYGAKPQKGAYFNAGFARYGADCHGCYVSPDGTSGTASGIMLSTTGVRQKDGSWKTGITYNGYYLVASSSSLPMCTIMEITKHSYTGMGLTPGVPFKVLVVDRGVSGSLLDLFVGSEKNLSVVRLTGKHSPVATIIGFAKLTKNSIGQRICK
jgi:hypothetical protein